MASICTDLYVEMAFEFRHLKLEIWESRLISGLQSYKQVFLVLHPLIVPPSWSFVSPCKYSSSGHMTSFFGSHDFIFFDHMTSVIAWYHTGNFVLKEPQVEIYYIFVTSSCIIGLADWYLTELPKNHHIVYQSTDVCHIYVIYPEMLSIYSHVYIERAYELHHMTVLFTVFKEMFLWQTSDWPGTASSLVPGVFNLFLIMA